MSDLNTYIKSISKFKRLSDEEQALLFQKIQLSKEAALDFLNKKISYYEKLQIDQEAFEARTAIINSNLPLVIYLAKKKNVGNKKNIMDLIASGNIGLIYAVDKYDPEVSSSSAIFVNYIKAIINHYLLKENIISLPNFWYERLRDTEIDRDELAAIQTVLHVNRNVFELDIRSKENDEEEPEAIDYEKLTNPILNILDNVERNIVKLYFGFGNGEPLCIADVARCLNMSRNGTQKIFNRSLNKIREQFGLSKIQNQRDIKRKKYVA